MDGAGNINYWGFSPAFDLLESIKPPLENQQSINILIIGAGDARHIIQTLARLKRHSENWTTQPKICFHILDCSVELYARQILQLYTTFDIDLPLQQKTECFLECLGNSLVRHTTAEYIQSSAKKLIDTICDPDKEKAPHLKFLDSSNLKFKEVDFLEKIMLFWRDTKPDEFDMKKLWDYRMRQALKNRYDSRNGVFDWDFHMVLGDRGLKIIHQYEYKTWRESGVAFQMREADYNTSNRTFASYKTMKLTPGGDSQWLRGYWGDTMTGPFISFGIDSEQQELFKKTNETYTKTAGDVSQYNLMSLFYEISTGQRYPFKPRQPNESETSDTLMIDYDEFPEEYDTSYFSVTFLSSSNPADLCKKSKFKGIMDVAFVGSSMFHNFTAEFELHFMKQTATVVVENCCYLPEVKKEQLSAYEDKIVTTMKSYGYSQTELQGGFAQKTHSANFTKTS